MPIPREAVIKHVAAILRDAHDREPRVGGLFNAYELAVSYLLLTGFYAQGAWDVRVEQPIQDASGGGKCDFLIPLDTSEDLWLELKMWWFCDAPSAMYRTFERYRTAPISDWQRLSSLPGDRAVLLVCVWDDHPGARERSERWVAKLNSTFPKDAHQWLPWDLTAFRYPSNGVQVHGRIHVWSSIKPPKEGSPDEHC